MADRADRIVRVLPATGSFVDYGRGARCDQSSGRAALRPAFGAGKEPGEAWAGDPARLHRFTAPPAGRGWRETGRTCRADRWCDRRCPRRM